MNDSNLSNFANSAKAAVHCFVRNIEKPILESSATNCDLFALTKRPMGVVSGIQGIAINKDLNLIRDTLVLYDFTTNSDALSYDHERVIKFFALQLVSYPDISVEFIIGRASQIGDVANNEELAQKRATSVMKYLKTQIVDISLLPGEGERRLLETQLLNYFKGRDLIRNRPGQDDLYNRSVTIQYTTPLVIDDFPIPNCEKSWLIELEFIENNGFADLAEELCNYAQHVDSKAVEFCTMLSDTPILGGMATGRLKNLQTNEIREIGIIFIGADAFFEIYEFKQSSVASDVAVGLTKVIKDVAQNYNFGTDFNCTGPIYTGPDAGFENFDYIPVVSVENNGSAVVGTINSQIFGFLNPKLFCIDANCDPNIRLSCVPIPFSANIKGQITQSNLTAEVGGVLGIMFVGAQLDEDPNNPLEACNQEGN